MKKLRQGFSFLLVICMLMTMMPEVDLANETTVQSVTEKLESINTLQEMQDAREDYKASDTYSDETAENHELMRKNYEQYLADMLTARADATEAYAALSEEEKKLIDPELVKKLDNSLDTVWNEVSYSVSEGVQDYQYQVVYPKYSYEMSNHMASNNGGEHNEIPQTLVLVDTHKYAGDWKPNGKYSFGSSNYEVVYCSDVQYSVVDGMLYQRVNLEDSTYYGEEAAKHIRAIVSNSYPYLSLEQMKANLAAANFEYAEQLTRSDIIAAVQMAIWNYSNGAELNGSDFKYSKTFDLNSNTQWGKGIHDYTNELWDWWSVDYRHLTVNKETGEIVNRLAEYLVGLEGEKANSNQIVINEVKIEGAEPVQAKENAYNVALKVQLNNGGTSEEDNIVITVKTESQVITKEVELGKAEYDMVIEAKGDETIHVVVEGKQLMPKGAYLYMPQPSDTNEDAREASQVLVGVAEGLTAIQATDSVTLDIPEKDPVTADMKLQKTDENGAAMTGSTFNLYFHGEEAIYNIGAYAVDEEGTLVVEGLLPGNYELVETVTPEGYVDPEKPIAFSINEEGVLSLAESDYAELVNGIVVVKNYPIKPLGSLSIKKVDSVSKKNLEGATFTLKGKDFEKTLITDKDGTLLFSELAYGEYTLTETEAPAGYMKDTTKWLIKIGDGEGEQIEWVQEVANKPVGSVTPPVVVKGSVEITKTDMDTGKTLAGAEFRLTDEAGNVIGTLTTDENGKATFENLPYGEYKVEETKAPKGYLLNKEATNTFTILEDGQKEEFTYENTRENPSLAVEKIADKTQYLPGETVTYTINVTNDGNVDLKGITLNDVFSKNEVVAEQQLTVEGYEGAFDLAIGETMSFTSKFDIPENDLADTTYKNVVTTSTGDISDEAEVGIVVDPTYAFTIEKTADKDEVLVGETVTYTIVVTNTGNKALTNVVVKDDMIGLDTVIDQLAVNESKTFTGEYVVTADDIGELENIVTATVEVDGEPITHDASVIVNVFETADAPEDDIESSNNDANNDDTTSTNSKDDNWSKNPQTGDTMINTLLALFVFVATGSSLYIYRSKLRG